MIDKTTYTGILRVKGKINYIETVSGEKIFENDKIWTGYINIGKIFL